MNKNFIYSVASALIAGVTGYFLGCSITKKKYFDLADKEVESLKRQLNKEYISPSTITETEKNTPITDVPSITRPNEDIFERSKAPTYNDYYNKINRIYSTESDEEVEEEDSEISDVPYIIDDAESGEGGYEIVTLFYFTDHILTDIDYNIIENVNGVVGVDNLESIGTYDDCIYIRNDHDETDYEVIYDMRIFKETYPERMSSLIREDIND